MCLFLPGAQAETLQLNGVAKHMDIIDNFIGGLYLAEKSTTAEAILASNSDLRMDHKIVNNRYSVSLWRNYLRKVLLLNSSPEKIEEHRDALSQLMSLFKGQLKRGDIISIIADGNATQIRLNNFLVQEYATREIAAMLLKGWIGTQPISRNFKQGVLGLNKSGKEREFYLLVIAPDRTAIGRQFALANASEASAMLESNRNGSTPSTNKSVQPRGVEKTTAQKIKVNTPVLVAPKLAEAKPAIATTSLNKTVKNTVKSTAKIREASVPSKALPHLAKHTTTPAETTQSSQSVPALQMPKIAFEQQLQQEQKYYEQLKNAIYGKVRYPSRAISKEIEGVVDVTFKIDSNGEVTNITAESTPESTLLTRAAISAVKKSKRAAAVDNNPITDEQDFSIAIRFQLTDDQPSSALVAR